MPDFLIALFFSPTEVAAMHSTASWLHGFQDLVIAVILEMFLTLSFV